MFAILDGMSNLFLRNKRIYGLRIIGFLLLICLLVCSFPSYAQFGRGCYVDGVLYTANTSKSNRHFYRTSGVLTSPCGFVRTGNTNNCRLFNGGNESNNSNYTLYNSSFSNDWDELICPIDDYAWLLMISVAGISILKFRRFVG